MSEMTAAPPTHVVFETTVGSFTVELYSEHAPKTCWNMAELARRGYYNNTIFHRIIKVALFDFMIQGGDPTGTGRGGESVYGYYDGDDVNCTPCMIVSHISGKFEDEIHKELKHTGAGIVSMIDLVMMAIPGKHTVFGRISEGMKVIQRMGLVPTGANDSCVGQYCTLRSDREWSMNASDNSMEAASSLQTMSLLEEYKEPDQDKQIAKNAVVELVNETELLDHSKKQAWIEVAPSLELSASTSIFAFIPSSVGDSDISELSKDNQSPDETAPVQSERGEAELQEAALLTTPANTHVIHIETVLDLQKFHMEQMRHLEKCYSIPVDIPSLGWYHVYQLGFRLARVAMCLRRNISARIIISDEHGVIQSIVGTSIGSLTTDQLVILAHSGLAFNETTEALVVCQGINDARCTPHFDKTPKTRKKHSTKENKKIDTKHANKQTESQIQRQSQGPKIGNAGAVAVFRSLRVNQHLRSLSLQHTGLDDFAMCSLTAMLRCNSTLTKLDLQGNNIGPLGIKELCDALEDIPDSTLIDLDLSHNRITDEGMGDICRAIEENETLVWLNLSWNCLSTLALLQFLVALRGNFALYELSIYGKDLDELQFCSNIEGKHAKAIAGALRQVNGSFARIRLSSAQAVLPIDKLKQSRWIDLSGQNLIEIDALVVADLLPLNEKLLTLDLSNNKLIERWGVLKLLANIKHCKTLKHVNLANTGLYEEVGEQIGDLVASNETLQTIILHETTLQIQVLRGCQPSVVQESMMFDIAPAHHFDRWILAKCLALNRPTQELNRLRLPVSQPSSTSSSHKLVSINFSGRTFEMYEVFFLSKKIFHHLYLGRVALNGCKIESYGARALADAVCNHRSLETLELENNCIGVAGGRAMTECVEFNASLKFLNMSWNKIGNNGALRFESALQKNQTLVRLDLRGNDVSAAGIVAISRGLQRNGCLQELFLRWNSICPRGAEALAEALTVNKALRVLDIEHHTMGPNGAFAFANMLAINTRLQELNMKGDDTISDGDAQGIGTEAGERLAVVLTETNKTLTHWNIGQNRIGKDAVSLFSNLLKFNTTLQVLDLSLSDLDAKIAPRLFVCLGMNHALTKLNLAHNRIGNEGMMACIHTLEVNKVLRELNVADNAITEEPLALLAAKMNRKINNPPRFALTWLCLNDNPMTETTRVAFRDVYASITIELEEPERHRG